MSEQAPAAEREVPPAAPSAAPGSAAIEHSDAPEDAAPRGRGALLFFFIAASVFVLDQVTKVIVRATLERGEAWPSSDAFLNIINVSNSGAAFGILQGQTLFLVVTSIVGVAAIVLYFMFPPLEHGLLRMALALQLGGAAGNLIDRIRSGEVTDFVNFQFWPAFNVADASITIGVATIFWFFLVAERERVRDKPDVG